MKSRSITLLKSRIAHELRERLAKAQDYKKSSQPFVRGDYTYFYKNDGLQNHSILYRQKEGQSRLKCS